MFTDTLVGNARPVEWNNAVCQFSGPKFNQLKTRVPCRTESKREKIKATARRRTFADLDTLYRLVIYRSCALLDQFVSFGANVDDLRALDGELNELFHHIVDDVSRGL